MSNIINDEWDLDSVMTLTSPLHNLKLIKGVEADRDKIAEVCEELKIGHVTKGYAFIGLQIDEVPMVVNVQDMELTAKEDDGIKVYGIESIDGVISLMKNLLSEGAKGRITQQEDLKTSFMSFLDGKGIEYVVNESAFLIDHNGADMYVDTSLKVYSNNPQQLNTVVKGFDHWDDIPEIKRMSFSVI